MSKDIAIQVNNISKTFKLPHEKSTSIKSTLINFRNRGFELQKVLDEISFEIKKGEFFGIVGRNGSGKSTLLKLISGIYEPTSGQIKINGKLTPFIELGVGFNPELTGRENVFLNGALLGFNRKEIETMYTEIIKFAEIERFMDQKLKNYSSGMQVRLAFSIAIRAKSDILVLDEVLAVGDASFQQKCNETFTELKKEGRTIVLVTHDMTAVLQFCDRALHLSDGNIKQIGSPKNIADSYLEANYDINQVNSKYSKKLVPYITGVQIIGSDQLEPGSSMIIEVNFDNKDKQRIHLGLQIFSSSGVYCFGSNTKVSKMKPNTNIKGKVRISLTAKLTPGTYSITAATMNESGTRVYDYRSRITTFRIINSVDYEGVALLDHKWEYL